MSKQDEIYSFEKVQDEFRREKGMWYGNCLRDDINEFIKIARKKNAQEQIITIYEYIQRRKQKSKEQSKEQRRKY